MNVIASGRLMRHTKSPLFQLTEVMVTRDMFEKIGRLRFNPG
jgi:hypothetical protein